ncbi:MAG: M20 family metallopeptidase [Clostridia bacterium]|nr:M20 family metallopeptidase [Clostridia bacterium]
MEDIAPMVAEIRKGLHKIAETAYNETKTSRYVAEVLQGMGLQVTTGVAKTGVVALIKGGAPGPTVALRSDMDALPVAEETGVEWKSETPGVMHACGHDSHMAMLLGGAMLLTREAPSLRGNVKLIFQPAEEAPGGAEPMISEGVMENPHVDAVIGMHVTPELTAGQVGMKRGYATAAQDRFFLSLKGRGGHAATPQKTIDALAAACEFVCGLQQIVARRVDPLEPAIVSVGKLNAGTTFNIVADSAEIAASVRTLSERTRTLIEKLVRARVAAIEGACGVEADLNYVRSYPEVVNEPGMASILDAACRKAPGVTDVIELPTPSMVGEDFAYYAQHAPGVLMWLGAAHRSGEVHPLHSSKFLVADETLALGPNVWRQAAVDVLSWLA